MQEDDRAAFGIACLHISHAAAKHGRKLFLGLGRIEHDGSLGGRSAENILSRRFALDRVGFRRVL